MVGWLIAALASAADPTAAAMIAKASGKLTVAGCTGPSCDLSSASRYRVERTANTDPTSKDRAFADDGTYCGVLGDKRCTSNGRPVLIAPLLND